MKTHAIRVHAFGGPEALRWEAMDLREPRPGEVVLRHTAVGLNFVEVMQRTGAYPARPPFTPGNEGAGVVEVLGEGVTGLRVGDRVAYAPVMGSYSERRLIAAERLVRLPDGIDDRSAAGMMLGGMTAQYLCRQIHRVGAGEVVLVQAAAGGVGLLLSQWAASLGATVIGVVSTVEKARLAMDHGCAHAVLATEDVLAAVRTATGGAMADVAFDAVGRDSFAASMDSLRPRGHLVSYGQASGPVPPLDIAVLGRKGSLTLTRGTLADFTATRDDLVACAADLFAAVERGDVRVRVNQSFPLRDAALAHAALEARQTTGSTVLLP